MSVPSPPADFSYVCLSVPLPLQTSGVSVPLQVLLIILCRNFLRLGNPLSCSINDITVEELQEAAENDLKVREPETSKEQEVETPPSDHVTEEDDVTNEKAVYEKPEFESKLTNQIAPYGDSLSLARIQSLVSMTTPRDGYQPGMIGNPPFVEFDLSIDGFGCLFFPSIFPQTVVQNAQGGQAANSTTTGIGAGGERPFPPNNGITFSTWIFMSRWVREVLSCSVVVSI